MDGVLNFGLRKMKTFVVWVLIGKLEMTLGYPPEISETETTERNLFVSLLFPLILILVLKKTCFRSVVFVKSNLLLSLCP